MYVGNQWDDLYESFAIFRSALKGRGGLVVKDEPRIRKAQASIPVGGRILVSLKEAFLLDFTRNPIWHFNHPGMVSPPPGLPFPADRSAFDDLLLERTTELPRALAGKPLLEYLRTVGADYLIFERGAPGDEWWPDHSDYRTVESPWARQVRILASLIYQQLEEIKDDCDVLYNDGDIVALDLKRRGGG